MLKIISRDAAHAAGLSKYFTGRPCRRGHVAERYVSMGGCLDCLRRKATKTAVSVYMPLRPIYFPDATALEAQAAFRYVEANGWFTAAVQALRADLALMAQFTSHLTGSERLRLAATEVHGTNNADK